MPKKNTLIKEMIKEEEIDAVWGNSDFGPMTKMDVVKFGLLKCASGYYQGYTSKSILIDLGLITQTYKLTKRGRYCLWEFFGKNSNF
jgi:hypothetical protein